MKTELRVPAGHPALEGHFPGRPIVPAVVLLAEVMAAVESSTSLAADTWTLSSAKFLAPVMPEMPLTLELTQDAGGTQRFEIRGAQGLVASGALARGAP